MRFWE